MRVMKLAAWVGLVGGIGQGLAQFGAGFDCDDSSFNDLETHAGAGGGSSARCG